MPGELIHIDGKKPGKIDGISHRIAGGGRSQGPKRGTGREALHAAIGDASRLAHAGIPPGETKESATCFRKNALACFVRFGIAVERIMSDNGSAYESHVSRDLLQEAGPRHARASPHAPKTDGKALRLIQTSSRAWIHAVP
ncbi:MAG: hypothetical protein ACREDM_07585 [Methylocella sp.]